MHKEGLKSIFQMEEISVMGIWELLPHLYNMKASIYHLIQCISKRSSGQSFSTVSVLGR